MAASSTSYNGTGRRKTAVARIRLVSGTGDIIVNGKKYENYFGRKTDQMIIRQPLELTSTDKSYNVLANVNGGGLSGQAGAIKHGIARALLQTNSKFRKPLRDAGFLTRDSRMVERKKYGKRGARRSFQFSKR